MVSGHQGARVTQVAYRHDCGIVAAKRASHGGHVVKTTGDLFHAAFVTPHDALEAALALSSR
jgi:class 3 adenylate cyclase